MSAILHRNLVSAPPLAVRGEGIYLFDAAGRRYIDASGGAAVSCLGHSSPRVVEAIARQAALLPFAHTAFFTSEPAEALAAHLVAHAPEGFGAGRAAFVGSGSEAMEVALKLARQVAVERGEARRSHLIGRRMSYHGNTLGALSVGGHMARRDLYAPLLLPVSHIDPCHAYREKREDETLAEYGLRAADQLEAEIHRVGPETVLAFVAETVSGATLGCAPPAPGYFRRIREICDRHGVIFIADEVMCGMGRTGSLFVIAQEGVCPDIVTIAKGLGAGYQPIAAVLARESLVEALTDGSGALANGQTYMGHPVACAAALAVLETIRDEGLLAAVRERGAELRALLERRFGQHPHVGDIRGRGLFLALEFVQARAERTPFRRDLRLAERLKASLQEAGLIAYPSSGAADGVAGDHVLLAPPYIVTSAELGAIVDILERVLADILPA